VARVLGRLLDADWAAVPAPSSPSSPSWGPRGPPPRHALTRREAVALLATRGPDLDAVLAAADALRARTLGAGATFVANRNVNYTNVCARSCDFCAFSASAPGGGRGGQAGATGPTPASFPSASGGAAATVPAAEAPYFLSPAAIAAAAADAWAAGATEVCMQGGIAPAFEGPDGLAAYEAIIAAAKAGAPGIHVHALSPLEVWTAAGGDPAALPAILDRLAGAGLGSLPGTAAEVLVARVRAALFRGARKKISAREWLTVMAAAHAARLRSTSTLMFGAANDGPADWAAHLAALRALQARTGGFTEFVPLPFVPDLAPGFAAGRLRSGPTRRDCLAVTAVARLFLAGSIDHVQASWPKLGPAALPRLLAAGADDMGGVLMSESISRAAGARFGSALSPADMAAAAVAAGRVPAVRTTLYGRAPEERVVAAFGGAGAAAAAGVVLGGAGALV
jgi:FO synthase